MNDRASNSVAAPASYFAETRSLLSSPGVLAWLTTLDHKRLGILYLVATSLALLAVGVLSLALHQDLASSTLLAFLFMVPALPATLGNFMLPLEFGLTRAALPRVSLAGFWLYVLGAGAILWGLAVTQGGKPVAAGLVPMSVGALVLSVSATLTSINALATVGKGVARGVRSAPVTLFAWALSTTSVAQLLSTLALAGLLLLVGAAHLPLPPLLVTWLPAGMGARLLAHPWAYLSPAGTLMLVPAVGLISDIFGTFTRRSPAGYGFLATSLTALAFLQLVAWGSPLLGGGDTDADAAVQFGLATSLLAVPLAVSVVCWVATLQSGRIALDVPMLWALGFVVQLSVGALAGVLLGVPPSSVYLHGTLFEAGYRDYLFTATPCIGFLAGAYYAWPKMTGRLYDSRAGTIAFVLVFVGVQVTFLPEMASGLRPDLAALAELPRYGSWVIAAGGLLALVNLAASLRSGARSPANPWNAVGLEWTTGSPPPLDNFVGEPGGTVKDARGGASQATPATSSLAG